MKPPSCRVCGDSLGKVPLLRYQNMPKSAQNFPTAEELSAEYGANLTVCQCTGCGLVQLIDPPVPYHRDVIRAAAISDPVRQLKRTQFMRLVEQFDLEGKRVIEVGCGNGEFLSLWQGLGVRAIGLEHAGSAVTVCRTNGLEVFQGYVETAEQALPGGPYDAFALIMFLEHMPNPNAALAGIRNNLAESAVGLVEVPNFDMIIEKCIFAEFIADHLFYFTRDSLAFTLQRNGFEILDCSTVRDDYVISAIVRKRCEFDLAHFADVQAQLTTELGTFISNYPPASVAVWGAGHQALALISLADLGNKLKYVVDSAPFKQGRYTPATHLPIMPPETLDTDPPAALIIMAASYSDEIADIVRARFGKRLPFSILRESGLEFFPA